MSMWDARFGSHSLEMPAHVAFYVSHLLTIGILLFCLLHLIIYPLIHTICSWLLSLVYMPFLLYSASLQYVAGCTLTMNWMELNIEDPCPFGMYKNMRCLQWHCSIQSLHVVTPDVVQAVPWGSMAQMNIMHTLTIMSLVWMQMNKYCI